MSLCNIKTNYKFGLVRLHFQTNFLFRLHSLKNFFDLFSYLPMTTNLVHLGKKLIRIQIRVSRSFTIFFSELPKNYLQTSKTPTNPEDLQRNFKTVSCTQMNSIELKENSCEICRSSLALEMA